jgi:ABC-2 type transport system permease protein
MTETSGEVFDLGYQHYDGPREGRRRARLAVWKNGMRTALGLGRGPQAKILPILLFVAVIIPAVVLSIIASQVGPLDDMPGHSGYYQIVSIILFIFAAIIAPELLCTDRRDGVINLYLVRPLTTTDYVAGRWLAFFSITLVIVYLGQVVLFLGLMLAADGPLGYVRDNWLDIPRFLAAGFIVGLFTTTLPMAVAAFTTRRAYASAFVIGLFIISTAVAGALTGENSVTGDAAKWVALIDIGSVPIHLNDMIFVNENTSHIARLVRELPTAVPIVWYVLLTAGPGLLLWWRYRRMGTGT